MDAVEERDGIIEVMKTQSALGVTLFSELLPFLIYVGEDGTPCIVGFEMPCGSVERDEMVNALIQEMTERRALAYAVVTEVWTAVHPVGTNLSQQVRPSELPLDDRGEAVVITGGTREGRFKTIEATIHHEGRDQRTLGPWSADLETLENRFHLRW